MAVQDERPYANLWERVIRERNADYHGIHGPQHWARVERNGLYLAKDSGADVRVVSLFALFHDSCRINDGFDPEHGSRGAEYARQSRGLLQFLDDTACEQLLYACTWHTDQHHHDDPTIHTCFDADRLDLGRVGITPHADFLNTPAARKLAAGKQLFLLDEVPVRNTKRATRPS